MAGRQFKPLDVTGQRFHNLTAVRSLGRSHFKSGGYMWEFLCDCGKHHVALLAAVKHGTTYSCGCLTRAKTSERSITHGHARNGVTSPTYRSWKSMHDRCTRPSNISYPNYGGRGITICERWESFENFIADMGERPFNKTLDRINNDKNYEPSNCRWATRSEQSRNRRKWGKNATSQTTATMAPASERTP